MQRFPFSPLGRLRGSLRRVLPSLLTPFVGGYASLCTLLVYLPVYPAGYASLCTVLVMPPYVPGYTGLYALLCTRVYWAISLPCTTLGIAPPVYLRRCTSLGVYLPYTPCVHLRTAHLSAEVTLLTPELKKRGLRAREEGLSHLRNKPPSRQKQA